MEPFTPTATNAVEHASKWLMLESRHGLEGITAGFTTRHAGNMALHVGDDEGGVLGNRAALTGAIGWAFEAFTCAEQVHDCRVRLVTADDVGRGRESRADAFPDTDAMITDVPDVLLTMFYADCVPLYFYDPQKRAIGLAHAGWKGTVLDVAGKTVAKMREAFGTKPQHLYAAIGPSIGGCCYEVDEPVLRAVSALGIAGGVLPSERQDRARLDLKHLNRELMIKAGVTPDRIEQSSLCTSCRTDMLFSHRAERGRTGRMAGWLGMKSG